MAIELIYNNRYYKGAKPVDKIHIHGLRVFSYHGVHPEEKEKGQPFVLDITIESDLSRPGTTDELTDTINYAKVSRLAVETMQSEKNNLIERAATRVADAILRQFPASAVTVLLKKPRAPIAVDFDDVAVEITRERRKQE